MRGRWNMPDEPTAEEVIIVDLAFKGGKRTYRFEFERNVRVTVQLEVPDSGVSKREEADALHDALLACPEAFEHAGGEQGCADEKESR